MLRIESVSSRDDHPINIQGQKQTIIGKRNRLLYYLSFITVYFRKIPDPELVWEIQQEKRLYSEFYEFIEFRFEEVKRQSSIQKYYAKIVFQIFIYCLNTIELIFTLLYAYHNQFPETAGAFFSCYLLSTILCGLMHVSAWIYQYIFTKVIKIGLLDDIIFLIYIKIAPFIYYFKRDQSIRQFSFSEINKYLRLSEDDKFRNPCMLFKKRTKDVNIFRDLKFHRVALLSRMITMTFQTVPQLFIQGLYNTYYQRWDDRFNVVSYLILLSNLLYCITELFFIIFMTTYRQMKTALNLQLSKIQLKYIQETKQLLKADLQYMGFVKSFYFHIDPSTFSSYQKKRCMVQIIFFLTKQKQIKIIQFLFIDKYEIVTLQYLANCFKLIQVETISLLYKDVANLQMLQDIFQSSQFPNLQLELIQDRNSEQLWNANVIDPDAQNQQDLQIQFIENPKITSGWQVLKHNQRVSKVYQVPTQDFVKFIQSDNRQPQKLKQLSHIYQQPQSQPQERPEDIIKESLSVIERFTKRVLLEEKFGKLTCLITLYYYYLALQKINQIQGILQIIKSLYKGSLQIVTLVFLISNTDIFVTALIVLNSTNSALQMLSFIFFSKQFFQHNSFMQKICYALLFGISIFFMIWEGILIILYISVNQFTEEVQRDFSAKAYIKFKSYAIKFKGSLAISVFQNQQALIDSRNIQQIKEQSFFQAVMWRASVEEALNKIPSFFVFILALTSNSVTFLWVISFFNQIMESIFAVKDILEVVVKDFFIPALILSKYSEEQFFQSMLYFRSISNSMRISQIFLNHFKKKCTFKINVSNLDFSYYEGNKKIKMLAQFRYVLASITSSLEIDQAQRLFYMGPEINDLIRCLKVSPMKQLKLIFHLDEVNPSDFHYINELQFLQIQVEATEIQEMQFMIARKKKLKAFSYSFFQKIYKHKHYSQVASNQILNIDNQFLKLDKYNFERFNFEILGNLNLQNCAKFFANFQEMKAFKISLHNCDQIQNFNFSDNIKSRLEDLDVNFDNISLQFQQFPFENLKKLKMTLKKCEFDTAKLYNILYNLTQGKSKEIFIDMSQCDSKFNKMEKTQLLRAQI